MWGCNNDKLTLLLAHKLLTGTRLMARTLRKESIAGNRRDGNLSTSVDERIRVGYWLNDIYSGKPKFRLKTCSSATSSTTNRTRLVWDQTRAYARRGRWLDASATARPKPHIQYEFWHLKRPARISFCYLSVKYNTGKIT